MNTKDIGERSEAKILSAILDKGIPVLMPWGDNQRYDFVIEVEGKFLKIQCKTASKRGNVLRFPTRSLTTKNGKPTKVGYKGQIDYFMIYSPDTQDIYCIHVDDCGKDECCLRTEESKINIKTVRYAKDYLLSNTIFK